MEQRRFLFKSNASLLRDKTNNIKTANEIRTKQRRDLFSSTRNISPSPSPQRQTEHKENLEPTTKTSNNSNAAKFSPPKENKKQLRQKAYLMKYLAWKANKMKEEQAKKEQSKRPAFVVPCGGGPSNGTRNMKKSFAPKNHSFKPPDNLKDLAIDIVGQNQFRCKNGNQQGVYSFVPTPKKDNSASKLGAMKLKTSRPINSKPLYLKSIHKPEASKPVFATKPPITKTPSKTLKSVPHNKTNGKVVRPPSTQTLVKSSVKSETKTAIQAKPLTTTQNSLDVLSNARTKQHPVQISTKDRIQISAKPPVEVLVKPPVKKEGNIGSKFKLPPPSQYINKITKKTTSKVNSVTSKTSNSQLGLPPLKRPTLKASKKLSGSISNAFTASINGSKIKKSTNKFLVPNPKAVDIVSETPTDVNSLDTVFEFVTSTKRKSSSLKNSKVDLFAIEGDILSPVDSFVSKVPDFVRYSIVEADANANGTGKQEASKEKEPSAICTKEDGVIPIKDKTESTTSTTYLSPYVSVSRGKVSTKIEREKRNSVYMGGENSSVTEAAALKNHTIATVRYYQKQLTEEVNRLNDQCKIWEEYKETNSQLADVGGTDMIDATIGQTKLLINKKLKQFGGLIDRCEEGLRQKKSDMLPVLPEDLDGFWSMVGLQIENVDKRFANIERWKANNWKDPDEVQIQKANVKKVKRTKPAATARPNQTLQKMLKAAHAAYLKKKAVGDVDDDVILTPSRRQVVIKDRRSRSAAATVITVNTTKAKRISNEKHVNLNETPKLIPHVNGFRKSMNLLKSTLLGEQDCKSPVSSSNQVSSRKSILKTPGSVRRSRNVIFDNNPIKFTIEDTLNDSKSNLEHNVEEEQRTYKLRNRRIILRDSAEFEIPK